jgi:hypothetical protein
MAIHTQAATAGSPAMRMKHTTSSSCTTYVSHSLRILAWPFTMQ